MCISDLRKFLFKHRRCFNLGFLVFVCLQISVFCLLFLSTSTDGTPNEIETKFEYFLRPNYNNSLNRYQVELHSLPQSVFLYSHGFRTIDLESAESIKIKNAVFQTQNIDMVVLVDWSAASMTWNYPTVADKIVPKVAKNVSNEILWMQRQFSIQRSQIQLAGHSLGAHIMGQTAEILQKDKLGKISNITGIDPAGPLYDDLFDNGRLSKDDAHYVRCIFTDPGLLGTSVKNCTENLFPCSKSNCTNKVNSAARHNRAKKLFIDMLHGRAYLSTEPVKDSFITWFFRCLMKLFGRNLVIYIAVHTEYLWFAGTAIVIDIIFVLVSLIRCCFYCFDHQRQMTDIEIENCSNPTTTKNSRKVCQVKVKNSFYRGVAIIVIVAILTTLLMVALCSYYHER